MIEVACNGTRVSTSVIVFVLLLLPSTRFSAGQDANGFDGIWNVTLICPTDKTTLGYTYHFAAQVKNGVLHGEHGTTNKPGWVALDGSIQADGTATLNAKGLTNIPIHAAYQVRTGTPYAYTVNAHFDKLRGNGERIELRACILSFIKR